MSSHSYKQPTSYGRPLDHSPEEWLPIAGPTVLVVLLTEHAILVPSIFAFFFFYSKMIFFKYILLLSACLLLECRSAVTHATLFLFIVIMQANY